MKCDEGSVLVVDDNEVNRELLARPLQRQGDAVSVYQDRFGMERLRRAARIGAGLEKKRLCDRKQADLLNCAQEQSKSERLAGKEKING